VALEGQAAGCPVLGEPLAIAQQQLDRQAGCGEAGRPQAAEAAAAEHMPGAGHGLAAAERCRRLQAMRPLPRASSSCAAAWRISCSTPTGQSRLSTPIMAMVACGVMKPSLVFSALRLSPS